jgi:nitrate/nitrite-specific signal transduction histidine kinase
VREELYRIGREALLNALRHARAQRIEVELEYARHAVRLLVRDDGIGIDPDVLQAGRAGHYGLSGLRERAERIGGRLRVLSAAGAGTEVEVVVRGAVAFAAPRPVRGGWLRRLARRGDAASADAATPGSGGARDEP